MKPQTKFLNGKRVGIFGKGGSGKSTVTVMLAKALAAGGYRVCVLDADSTNVGLSQALGYAQPPATMLDYFGGMVFSGGLVTCPVDDPTPLEHAEINLAALPGEYFQTNDEGITLLSAGKIGNQGPGAGCDGPIAKIARDLKITLEDEQPVTLIDFKAGFEDSARGAITSLDWGIVVVDPTIAAVEMAVNMRDMVKQIQADVLPATSHLETEEQIFWANKQFTDSNIRGMLIVLNNIPDRETEEYLRNELADHQIEVAATIYRDNTISSSWLRGLPVVSSQALDQLRNVIDELEKRENTLLE